MREANDDPWLVEGDVSVGPDPQDLEVHSPGIGDRPLVRRARSRDVTGQAVRPRNHTRREVHARHEVTLDHRPIALRVVGRQPDVLVEGETTGCREADLPPRAPVGEVSS